MTQIVTTEIASIQNGPRGIGARAVGGTYTQDCQQDLIDSDCFQVAPTVLTGTTDAIPGFASGTHFGGNYVIETGQADAITLPLPTDELDDNLTIAIYSNTAFAHTVTLPSALFASGAALHGLATFAAFRGAGLTLRAWNGSWQVVSQSGITFSA
jgi:hypothetical protein